jgi:hypothetical protein
LGFKGKRTCWVQGIDIDGEIDRLLCSHSIFDLLDDTLCTYRINLSGFHDFKTAVAVIVVVAHSGEGGTYTGVDVGVIGEEALFVGMVEVCAVIYGGLL